MMTPPAFWSDPDGGKHPLAIALRPISALYGAIVARKLDKGTPAKVACPVICVGNISLGGVGKTPFTALLATALTRLGRPPHILMRGYGGALKGPVRVTPAHGADQVGDEARMLAHHWPVWVAKDRAAGAAAAAKAGAAVIVMDDGFQNPSVHKDISFVLVDETVGWGNGAVFPAGPLREPPEKGLARATALVRVGGQTDAGSVSAPAGLAELRAHLQIDAAAIPRDQPLFAFAGIGRPAKFFDSLADAGHAPVQTREFADHHPYTPAEISQLRAAAAAQGATLVTTEKDFARLAPAAQAGIVPIPAHMVLTPMELLEEILTPLTQEGLS